MADVAAALIPEVNPSITAMYEALDLLGMFDDSSTESKSYAIDFFTMGNTFPVPACAGGNRSSPQVIGRAYSTETVHHTCPTLAQTSEGTVLYYPREWMIDVNGDGVQDKVYCSTNEREYLNYKLARPLQGQGTPVNATDNDRDQRVPAFGAMCQLKCSNPAGGPSAFCGKEDRPFSMAVDVDGDGATNLVAYDQELGWAALVFEPSGPRWETSWFSDVSIEPHHRYYVTAMDVNGDGLRDILALRNPEVTETQVVGHTPIVDLPIYAEVPITVGPAQVAINTGAGFRQQRLDAEETDGNAPKFPAYVVDIDQDGIEELVEPTSACVQSPWVKRNVQYGRIDRSVVPGLAAGAGVLGDFDGDGNIDAMTMVMQDGQCVQDRFRKVPGKGRTHGLLKSVVDGLGRRIDIEYARTNAFGESTYTSFDSTPCSNAWPHHCIATVGHALVSRYTEGQYLDLEPAALQRRTETVFRYKKARMDIAGYGWLGFGVREETVRDAVSKLLGATTTRYEDPGAVTAVPYNYPKAGLPTSVFTRTGAAELVLNNGTIGTGAARYETRTSTTHQWGVRLSDAGRPFAFLDVSDTHAYVSLEGTSDALQSNPLSHEHSEFDVDQFGNVTDSITASTDTGTPLAPGAVPGTQRVREAHVQFTPSQAEIDSWLVSLPRNVELSDTPPCNSTADCAAKRKTRTSVLSYFTNTNRLRSVFREPFHPQLQRLTELSRDVFGNVLTTTVTDAAANTRQATTIYDERGLFPINVIRYGEQKSFTTQVRYDDRFGTLIVQADPNGIDETWTFDAFGVARHHRGPGGEVVMDYEPSDLHFADGFQLPSMFRTITAQQGGATTTQEFNGLGQLLRTRSTGFDGAVVAQELAYDERQRLTHQALPHEEGATPKIVVHRYDDLDRIIQSDYPDDPVASVRYEYGFAELAGAFDANWGAVGAVGAVRTVDPKGHGTVAVYDRDGRELNVIDAEGGRTRYKYGAFGQLNEILDPADRPITFIHDAYGRTTSVDDPARGVETTEYNGLDDVVETTDALNRINEFVYDDFGRLVRIENGDGVSEWIYDGDGESANEADRLVETISPSNQQTLYRYEARTNGRNRGLLTTVTNRLLDVGSTVPRELTTEYTFNDFSQLQRVDYPGLGSAGFSVVYNYDAGIPYRAINAQNAEVYWELLVARDGFRVGVERVGTASCGGQPGVITTRNYDNLGRLSSLTTTCDTQTLQNLSYSYDPSGNLTSRRTASGFVETFDHDALNRLTHMNGQQIVTYDPLLGRIKTKQGTGTYTYQPGEGRDWIATAGSGLAYDQDNIGNIRVRTGSEVPGGRQEIDYSAFDLPTEIRTGELTQTSTAFRYSADGERVVRHTPTGSVMYAGEHYQRTTTSAGSTNHRYMIYAGGRPVAQVSRAESAGALGSPTFRYLHDDVLGSIDLVTTASGAIESSRYYSPFGERSGGLATELPYGFTGHEEDADLGLVNMRGRMYDPKLGQFLSADPIVQQPYGQGLNRFAYVMNSPLNLVDPTGFRWSHDTKEDIASFAISGPIAGSVGLVGEWIQESAGRGDSFGEVVAFASMQVGIAAAGSGFGVAAAGMGAGAGAGAAVMIAHRVHAVGRLAKVGQVTKTTRGTMDMGSKGPVPKGSIGVAQSEAVPPWSKGDVKPGEPFADPYVRREMRRAFNDSNPTSDCFSEQATCDPTREQGGWILERPRPEWSRLGRYYIQRWSDKHATHKAIPVPTKVLAPKGHRLAGSFHTHPNLGWEPSASPIDVKIFANRATPHYIVSNQGTFRLTSVQHCLGPGCPSSLNPFLIGGAIAGGVGASVGLYAALD